MTDQPNRHERRKADALQKAATKYVAPVDEEELTLRLIECSTGMTRPPGEAAGALLGHVPVNVLNIHRQMARKAMEYWGECIEKANSVQ